MSSFIHLNVHSHYSKGWGVATLEELCRSARKQGMRRLALTDTDNLYGLIFFLQTAQEMGLEPIVGSELVCGEPPGICQSLPAHFGPSLPPGLRPRPRPPGTAGGPGRPFR